MIVVKVKMGCFVAIICGVTASCTSIQDTRNAKELEIKRPTITSRTDSGPTSEKSSPSETLRPQDAKTTTKTITERGTGQFFNRAIARRAEVREAPSGDITLNFVNADIREVVRSVLGATLGLNFSIDQGVKGMVTLQTSRPIARDAILPTLETILRQNGVALVRSSGLIQVMPAKVAPPAGGAPRLSRRSFSLGSGFMARIVPLRYASPLAIADILKPFAPPDSILRVDAERNLLILAGTREELSTLSEIVNMFDVDWFTGTSFALVKLEQASPKDLVKELESVFGSMEQGPLAGAISFTPLDRIGSILVVTPKPHYLDKAKEWIERLDVGADTVDRRLFVYRVQNIQATDLASVLDQVFVSGGARRSSTQQTGALAPGRRPVTLASRLPPRAETPGTTTSPTRTSVTQATQAPAAQRSPSRPRGGATTPTNGERSQATGSSVFGNDNVRIIADDLNNAILVMATASEYRQIEAAIKKLDVVPLQVLIEATIAEVTLTDELRYGVQWFLRAGDSSFTLSSNNGVVAPQLPGFAYILNAGSTANVILDALDSVTEVNLLSSPNLMVKDNRTATIEVGDQVPVATQSAQSITDPGAPLVSTVQLRNTGILLQVTPRVNSSGLVSLDIEQEVSNAEVTESSGIDSPTISQRRIVSSVVVHSGQTIALGGLIQNQANRTKSGLPVLSHIPILGALFGGTSNKFDRRELLVLITPRVVRNREEAQRVTDELRSKIRVLTRDEFKPRAPQLNQ